MTWAGKYYNKKSDARAWGIEFLLSLEEYIQLANDAGISLDQIGRRSGEYCLGRIGDVGPYKVGNCRFITTNQNHREKVLNGGQARATEKVRGVPNDKVSKALTGRTKETYPYIKGQADKMSKRYRVVSPDGQIFEGLNLNQFCKDMALTQANMSAVCRGQKSQHKGWTGTYVE